MLSKEEQERYSRHLKLKGFGENAQLKLKNSTVLVVGAGGLGCPVLQYLCAAGVGTLGIVDNDVVQLSNLQRQVLYSTNDIGEPKVQCAKNKLEKLNNHTHFQVFQTFLNVENALEIIKDFDIVVDCSDNFATRYLVNDACVMLNKPFVYGALQEFSGQWAVFNHKDCATYRCLFPEIPNPDDYPSCNEVGVLGLVPGIIGMHQGIEVIKLILEQGEGGVLNTLNTLTGEHNAFKLEKQSNTVPTQLTTVSFDCNTSQKSVSWDEALQLVNKGSAVLLDVREANEFSAYNIGGTNIPLSKLSQSSDITTLIPNELKDKTLLLFCQSGIRSLKAQVLFSKQTPSTSTINIEGGVQAYPKII